MYNETYETMLAQAKIAGEHSDCGVKAVAATCGVQYTTALQLLRILGRPAKRGTMFTLIREAVRMLGKQMLGCETDGINAMKLTPKPYAARTVRTIPIDPYFSAGRFLVIVAGGKHILAVVDGKVLDWTAGGVSRIVAVWQVI